MQGNTSSNTSSITENSSLNFFPSSSISYFPSQILSFDNTTTQFYDFDCTLNPSKHISAKTTKGSSKNQNFGTKTTLGKRSAARTYDHIIAERKRREKLSQSLIALAALIPDLKKVDKASVLGNAIKYIKELKERVSILEEDSKRTRVVVLKDPELNGENYDSSSCEEGSIENSCGSEPLLQVKARMSGQEVLLRIHCQKQKDLLVKILAQIQSLNLFVVHSSVLPFGDYSLDITFIAQMGEGYNLTVEDLVKNIHAASMKCMS
ncbi:hypothetical protein TanjilG_14282 [Lupinus angustifolius]|uniref:BHLH domain-containing protein n=2 Tax=Lupinus angustifolius TaxID=3871 RepID=A0A1J7G0R9_LUPAN|nr:hypothetical protein TanjilG_14282 [Lupinus angustifolius]